MGFLENRDFSSVPSITEFYRGKNIFITGGSGFMGKVLIEKLLYSCSDLDRIYLLMRHKKGVMPEDRLAQTYSSACFDRLRKEKPTLFESKVFIVAGDVMENGLGLSEEDRILLINRVNIVFHVAASVRFDDPLPYAVKMNLRGTMQMIELSKEIRNLFAFVHVSTSYSNTNREIIDEVIYPPLGDINDTLAVCENCDDHILKVLTPKYLGDVPNTYAFSKQLAEHVVYESKGQLPAVIIRPSIVISVVKEPVPGWIDNFNGPVGLLVASAKGIVRTLYGDPSMINDFIPVDLCIKCLIAAAWMRGTKTLENTDDIPIYNSCAGKLNNISMGEHIEIGCKIAPDVPMNGILWAVGGGLTTSKFWNYIKVLMFHVLPALLIDALLRLFGEKPMLLKIQRRIYIATLALSYYTTQQWTFENKNFIRLRSCIKDEDKKSFYYDVENVNIYEYYYNCTLGARRYLMKEKDEDLPKARVHYWRMHYLNMAVQAIFYGYVLWWFLSLECFQNIWKSIQIII